MRAHVNRPGPCLDPRRGRACLRGAGEINTLQGNLNWVASREHELRNPIWKGRESELMPLCNAAQSDSANLDNVAELMVRTGADPQEALMLLVPEAYRNHPDLMKEYPEVRRACMHAVQAGAVQAGRQVRGTPCGHAHAGGADAVTSGASGCATLRACMHASERQRALGRRPGGGGSSWAR